MRAPPDYFEPTRRNAEALWNKFTDPDVTGLAGWLFEQVRRPRLVLSELLQNADDAGATWARVSLQEDRFEFEHDGADFQPHEFAALCHFGNSNKRQLHTTGFRGIGFKSTFSVGNRVRVTTPTLDVEFDAEKYVIPNWIGESATEKTTRIQIPIRDEGARAEIEQSIHEWLRHPLSVLFFRNIRRLELIGKPIEKVNEGPGPGGTQRWKLRAEKESEYLIYETPPKPVPPACKEEIRKVRRAGKDFDIPEMKVTLVMGPEAEGRIYTILPTEAKSRLWFAINAPFLQEPDRAAIKTPAMSVTNAWLLKLAGEAAATALSAWVQDKTRSIEERAQAYVPLLPPPHDRLEGLELQIHTNVTGTFRAIAEKQKVVLISNGGVVLPGQATTVPSDVRKVWDDKTWSTALSTAGQAIDLVAREIDDDNLSILVAWNWVKEHSKQSVLRRLAQEPAFPRPANEGLVVLWRFVQEQLDHSGRVTIGSDWNQQRLDPSEHLYLAPRLGHDRLVRPQDLVRMPRDLAESSRAFIAEHLEVTDLDWLDTTQQGLEKIAEALKLSSRAARTQILAKLIASINKDRTALVRLGHVAADLNVEAPDDTPFLTRSDHYRTVAQGIFADPTGQLTRILGEETIRAICIADEYASPPEDVARQWRTWSAKAESRIQTKIEIRQITTKRTREFHGIQGARDFIASRGGNREAYFEYVQNTYDLEDHDFSPALVSLIEKQARSNPRLWAIVLEELLKTQSFHQGMLQCKLTEWGYSNWNVVQAGPMRAAWIQRFRTSPCLFGDDQEPHVPLHLARRTTETESMAGSVTFVRRDLDTTATAIVLDYLGVQSTVRDPGPVLRSLEALAKRRALQEDLVTIAKRFEVLAEIARREPSTLGTIRVTLSITPLIPTNDPECPFERLAAVCIRTEGDEFGIPAIHPALQGLGLWNQLGVPATPSLEQLVSWARGLVAGPLDTTTKRRMRRVLSKFGESIAEATGHWLTLAGTWESVKKPRYWTTQRATEFSRGLSEAYLGRIADCSMLDDESEVPVSLRDGCTNLASVLTYHLDFTAAHEVERRSFGWASRIGARLLQCNDIEAQSRDWAQNLRRTVFARYDGDIVATPHIEGEIAGGGKPVEIAWQNGVVHVPHYRWGKLSEGLADEVQRQVGERAIADAFRACIDRGDDFVDDYFATNFKLEIHATIPEPDPEPPLPEGEKPEHTEAAEDLPPPAEPEKERTRSRAASTATRGGEESDADSAEELQADEGDESDDEDIPTDDYTIVRTHKRRLPGDGGQDGGGHQEKEEDSLENDDPPGEEQPDDDTAESGSSEDNGLDEDSTGDEGTDPAEEDDQQIKRKRKHSAARQLLHQYATSAGFAYDSSRDAYEHPDGRELAKYDGLADWVSINRRSGTRLHYVVLAGDLDEGISLDAEIWGILLKRGRDYALLTKENDGNPILYLGSQLQELADRGALSYGATKCFIKKLGA